jgi:hypothetical protein
MRPTRMSFADLVPCGPALVHLFAVVWFCHCNLQSAKGRFCFAAPRFSECGPRVNRHDLWRRGVFKTSACAGEKSALASCSKSLAASPKNIIFRDHHGQSLSKPAMFSSIWADVDREKLCGDFKNHGSRTIMRWVYIPQFILQGVLELLQTAWNFSLHHYSHSLSLSCDKGCQNTPYGSNHSSTLASSAYMVEIVNYLAITLVASTVASRNAASSAGRSRATDKVQSHDHHLIIIQTQVKFEPKRSKTMELAS